MPVFLKLFKKIEEEEIFSNSYYEASIPFESKRDKDSTRKVKYTRHILQFYWIIFNAPSIRCWFMSQQNSYVTVLISGTSECNCIWR